MSRKRLDLLLVERGLAESRAKAQALIMAGEVRVDGEVALKPATSVEAEARLDLAHGPRFVSRGGEKLEAALEAFALDVRGWVCADVGASTGGFTDCLLQRGASRVYAIDVGKGILHWKLRNDPRVVVMEATNARHVEALPEPVSLVTVDASFISLKILLPVIKGWFFPSRSTPVGLSPFIYPSSTKEERGKTKDERRDVVALIKPQFEAGRKDAARGEGVIRDPAVHRQVLSDVLGFAEGSGYGLRGLIRSPLKGPKGNTEFLAWLALGAPSVDRSRLVDQVMAARDAVK